MYVPCEDFWKRPAVVLEEYYLYKPHVKEPRRLPQMRW
jgi:hypothetical protein